MAVTTASCPVPELPSEFRQIEYISPFILLLLTNLPVPGSLFHTYKQALLWKHDSTMLSQSSVSHANSCILLDDQNPNFFQEDKLEMLCVVSVNPTSSVEILLLWKQNCFFCCFSAGIRNGTWCKKNKWQLLQVFEMYQNGFSYLHVVILFL